MKFLSALQNPAIYPHPVEYIELIETHISWVILTGKFAYKIKKPINLGFLDFSTLDKRQFYCNEEIRLNKRLAPQLYLDVVSITEDDDNLRINGNGPVCEFAVRMKQFPQSQQFDRLLQIDQLHTSDIKELAKIVAKFHLTAPKATQSSSFGDPSHINRPILENFSHIRALVSNKKDITTIQAIEQWSADQYRRLEQVIKERKQQGFIRECHGDMHLRNIAYYYEKLIVFDGIEFSENLRWIDVISEVAFVEMDLYDRRRTDFANLLLNDYLEITGDYLGLRMMRFYMVYRAMVRAKVDCIRAHQEHIEKQEKQQILAEFRHYMNMALDFTENIPPFLLITHGLSGSGKTFITSELVKYLPIIRLRSDVERKRMFDIGINATSLSPLNKGIYSPQATEQVYLTLLEITNTLLKIGWSVVVDAAFLKIAQRRAFQKTAESLQMPFLILNFEVPTDQLRKRITLRKQQNIDASEADVNVLEKQLDSIHPLSDQENGHTISINSADHIDYQALAYSIQEKINSTQTRNR